MGLGRIPDVLLHCSLHVALTPFQANTSPPSPKTKSLKQTSNSKGSNTSSSTAKLRRCKYVCVGCLLRMRVSPTQAQVRELFTKLGVVGSLLDKVVKSISSNDETLLTFMRKVRAVYMLCTHAPESRLVLFFVDFFNVLQRCVRFCCAPLPQHSS